MKNYLKYSYRRKSRERYARTFFLMTITVAIVTALLYEKHLSAGEIVPHKDVYTTAKVTSYAEPIYMPCMYIYDDTMDAGEVDIKQSQVVGSREITVMEVYYKGMEIENKVIDTELVREAEPQVIHIGTYVPPKYIEPVTDYFITSEFGPRWGRNHNGLDMAVCTGTEVKATASGVVTRSSWYNGYGLCVDIDHGDGVTSRYAHLSNPLVEVGQEVVQGECIALSGNTGNSTGPHLHFELIFDGQARNPVEYMEEE